MKRFLAVGGIAVTAFVLLTGFRGGSCDGGGNVEEKSKRAHQYITWKVDDALDDLKATDAQKSQVNKLKDSLFEDGKALYVANKDVRKELVAEWDAQQPDATKIHRIVDERMAGITAFAHKIADAAIQLHGILTPEQRKEVSERAKKHQR